jgi:signal transduction protein with GAF and PtsI domain
MSSISQTLSAHKSPEQAFFESQKLPSKKRGITFGALFYRQLHQVTARIHDTENLEQIMLETSQDICKLLNADRLTLYVVNEDSTAIVSKIKTGLTSTGDIKLPISPQSIAGYVAYSKKALNLVDVYDEEALQKIHPQLSFLQQVDKRSGYRTRQMLVSPILDGDTLLGVLQVINHKSEEPFGELEVDGVTELCKTLATAIRQRAKKSDDSLRRASKYDGLVADGVLTHAELNQCVQDARNEGGTVDTCSWPTLASSPRK